MGDFWTSTPFGITLLVSIVFAMGVSVALTATRAARVQAGSQPANGSNWSHLAGYLLMYLVVMIVVTYAAIIVYYLAGSLIGILSVYQMLGATLGTQLWRVMQLAVMCLWLGSAALIFQRIFRRWLR